MPSKKRAIDLNETTISNKKKTVLNPSILKKVGNTHTVKVIFS